MGTHKRKSREWEGNPHEEREKISREFCLASQKLTYTSWIKGLDKSIKMLKMILTFDKNARDLKHIQTYLEILWLNFGLFFWLFISNEHIPSNIRRC